MDYITELEETLKKIQVKIDKNEDAKDLFAEADEILEQLKIEARGKSEKDQVKNFEERLHILKNRALLFDGNTQSKNDTAAGRQRVVSAKDRALQSGERIQQTQQIINDIEETGADIMSELQRNKETLENINGNVKETKGNLDKADKMVTRMGKWWSRW
mmetsp:Transcript_3077/g.4287  ORF Transcript_3077/g.4287 Transcript_3077/m.4287 type:complete len:159 (+) Transcript_3077:79-555(+)